MNIVVHQLHLLPAGDFDQPFRQVFGEAAAASAKAGAHFLFTR